MIIRFEELDWQPTVMGDLTLRRRMEPVVGQEIYEVKLGEEFLMSSLFTVAEEELAERGLAAVEGDELTVLVGGLGLGYTAVTALRDERVRALTVVDRLPAVIDWHKRMLLPVSAELVADARTSLVEDDFFALMRAEPAADERYSAILLDIDHSPRHRLDSGNDDFYRSEGLRALDRHLARGGVFALWSDDPPDDEFMVELRAVFDEATAHVVEFDNPVTGGVSSNTVYVARSRARRSAASVSGMGV